VCGRSSDSLFVQASRFKEIANTAAGNSFAFDGFAPEDDFGVSLNVLAAQVKVVRMAENMEADCG
jgi:hypothetical protein